MRIGGEILDEFNDPDRWVYFMKQNGYSAAICPVDSTEGIDLAVDYANAAEAAGILMAEVGSWSNPISSDDEERKQALNYCINQLEMAEEVGARCCVNIAGSRGDQWDAPHKDNLTDETFDMIVETVRKIIDAVKPQRTYFSVEMMPWIYPDSPESYEKLIKAIDRKAFAVHLDPVNIINSPARYFTNGKVISECFRTLGPYIKSCHAKDILLKNDLTVHLDEVRPGLGAFDYVTFLKEINKLDKDMPVIVEHLDTMDEYRQAADYIRSKADDLGIEIK